MLPQLIIGRWRRWGSRCWAGILVLGRLPAEVVRPSLAVVVAPAEVAVGAVGDLDRHDRQVASVVFLQPDLRPHDHTLFKPAPALAPPLLNLGIELPQFVVERHHGGVVGAQQRRREMQRRLRRVEAGELGRTLLRVVV